MTLGRTGGHGPSPAHRGRRLACARHPRRPTFDVVALPLARRRDRTLDRLAADAACRVLVRTGSGERTLGTGWDVEQLPDLTTFGRAFTVASGWQNPVYSRVDEDVAHPHL